MIEHHQARLELIDLTRFEDQAPKALADKMAESQRSEIQELKKRQPAQRDCGGGREWLSAWRPQAS